MSAKISRWNTFTAAPHRPMFFAGCVQAVAAMLWWVADLLGRYGGLYAAHPWPVPPAWAHGFLMIHAFFPFFIFGFLMTAMPSWLACLPVHRRWYVPAFLSMSGGVAVFYLGLFSGSRLILGAGVAVLLAGWAVAFLALAGLARVSTEADKRHAGVVLAALGFGWLSGVAYLGWMLTGETWMARASLYGGVWLFLAPVFLTVCHRMIPFFSRSVIPDYELYRPYWALYLLAGAAAVHGLLEVVGARAYLWLPDLALFGCGMFLSIRWQFRRSLKVKLLAVLHVGFLWVSIAGLLGVLQGIEQMLTGRDVLGLGPLHAITIGLFASLVIGMASRVTLGHSGRPLVADAVTWYLFLAVQTAAVVRVIAALPVTGAKLAGYASIVAGGVWFVAFLLWAIKYAPAYTRPRTDGKPG